jgi:ribosomal protein S12 methylthiotransferase accessory factor
MEITFDGGKVITAHINGHIVKTDQPVSAGGNNSAPTPFELFLASIGTCAGIYVKTFCDTRNIPSDEIKIILSMESDEQSGLPANIKIDIQLPGNFPDKYINSVINAAELCKVKKTITNQPKFQVITTKTQS